MVHPMWGWHHGSLARSVNTMAVWPMTRGQNVVESIRHRAIDSWSENSWGPRPLAIWQHKQPHRKSQTNNNGTNANKSTQMQTNAKAAETARPKLTELTSTSTAKVRALCGKRLAIQVWHLHNLNHFQHQYISILDFTRQVFNTVNRPSICRCFHSASKAPMTTPLSIVSIQPRLSSRHARISSNKLESIAGIARAKSQVTKKKKHHWAPCRSLTPCMPKVSDTTGSLKVGFSPPQISQLMLTHSGACLGRWYVLTLY